MFFQKISLKKIIMVAILYLPTIPEVVSTNQVTCPLGDI